MAAVVVLALLAGALLVWQQPWRGDTSSPSGSGATVFPADASTRLTAQLRDLSQADSEKAFVAATGAGDAARAFGRRTWQALRAVAGPGTTTFRYVSGGEVADRADGSGAVVIDISWRPSTRSGLDPAVTHGSTVTLRVAPGEDGTFSILGVAPTGAAVPLWLLGDVDVDTGPGRTVIRVDGGDATLPVDDMVTAARAAVERVIPDVTGELTIISPHTQAQMGSIVGQPTDAVAQIAAITTDIDGSATAGEAVVVLNPAVFATMDRRAAQVVLSHEAVHVLTSAVGTGAETWVVEGFADYVALRDDTAPLSVSAGQILAQVKAGTAPDQLPDDAAFGSTQHGLGAVYESAWMIFRMLGETRSDADIERFYRDVIGGTPVAGAVQDDLGLSLAELTAQWRAYLTKSASTVS